MTSFQTDECNTVLAAAPVAAEGSVKQPVRVAVGQMTAVGSTDQNFSTCAKLAQEASSAGAAMLFLPECFSFIGLAQTESLAVAEPLSGPLMSRYRALARDTQLWLSLGGFQEKGPDDDHL